MSYYDPDHQQAFHYTSRGHAQQNFVPQTTMSNGYNNNHVKHNTHQSDTFANDSNDAAMRHVGRFKKHYASGRTQERMAHSRFISRNDER